MNSTFQPQNSWKSCNGAVGTNSWIIPRARECHSVSPSPATWARQSTSALTWDKESSWSLCEFCHPWHNFGSANLRNNSPGLTLGHLRREQLRSAHSGYTFPRRASVAKKILNVQEDRSGPSKLIKKPQHGWNSMIFKDPSNPNPSVIVWSYNVEILCSLTVRISSHLSFSAHGQSSPALPSIKG